MPTSITDSRITDDVVAVEIEKLEAALLDDELFADVEDANGIVACRSTCVSGFTLKCDGSTFTRTCVSGLTLRCDG